MPPSSSETFFSCRPQTSAIMRPTRVEPVKLSTSTSGFSTSARPASAPNPCTTLSTPFGKPASSHRRPRNHDDSGVSSAVFSTTPLPQISAGKTFQAKFGAGVFAAMISPATPQGRRIVMAQRPAMPLVMVRPNKPLAFAGEEPRALHGGSGFAERVGMRLPASCATIFDSSSRRASISIGDAVQDLATLHAGHRGPGRLGAARGGNGCVDVGLRGPRHAGNNRT